MRSLAKCGLLVLLLSSFLAAQSQQESVLLTAIASKVQPRYPQAAKSRLIQGDVELKVAVNREGEVVEITPLSGHGVLVAASAEAVKQ